LPVDDRYTQSIRPAERNAGFLKECETIKQDPREAEAADVPPPSVMMP
jgi:hypothetical protein